MSVPDRRTASRLLMRLGARAARNAITLMAILVALLIPARRRTLVWGPVPIINNRYWSLAMREVGWDSMTLMEAHYTINARSDFDRYFDELGPSWLRRTRLARLLTPAMALIWLVRHARVVHLPFTGGPLGRTSWWRLEAGLFRRKGIHMIVMPYGGDAHLYSRVIDPSLRFALQLSYPAEARREREIADRVDYWTRQADVMITGTMIDGLGRTDVINVQPCCIDTRAWAAKSSYSRHDGRSGPVRVLHTPNHRGFKGTEFLLRSVEELQQEGLLIELVLLERVPNEVVRETMQEVDILAEQFIASIYAMSGIEGMASGLPVLVNLESEPHTRPFRRYSYLDECPAVSTSPETITANLRRLVTDPVLRETLGRAGRQYVDKYHSFATAQYMFGAIYRKILDDEDVDLMRLFHPLVSTFVAATPRIDHPLVESHLPPVRLDSPERSVPS
ncbi:MAG: glycosyltransferase [Candidatus Limnocylindria bacterium]